MPLIGRKYTRKLLHLKFNLRFIRHSSFLPLCCCIAVLLLTLMLLYQKRGSAAVLKLLNRSHKTKKQGRIAQRRRLIMSCLHSEFRVFLIRGFSVAISLKL